jgi:hypothetical protein
VLNGPTDTLPRSSGGGVLTACSSRRASSSKPIQRNLRISFIHSCDDLRSMKLASLLDRSMAVSAMFAPPGPLRACNSTAARLQDRGCAQVLPVGDPLDGLLLKVCINF